MADHGTIWTTVGSAGTLNQSDLAKVSLHHSIVELGQEVVNQAEATTSAPHGGATIPPIHALIRYNVNPVEGKVALTTHFQYGLKIRYRGHITATLMEESLETGAEKQLIRFDSSKFSASNSFQVQMASPEDDSSSKPLDPINKAYYVEATLTVPGLSVGHVSAISIIKLVENPFPPF